MGHLFSATFLAYVQSVLLQQRSLLHSDLGCRGILPLIKALSEDDTIASHLARGNEIRQSEQAGVVTSVHG